MPKNEELQKQLEDMQAQLAAVKAANAELATFAQTANAKAEAAKAEAETARAQAERRMSCKVSEKGCVQLSGMRSQFGVSYYVGEWIKIQAALPMIKGFILANSGSLTSRNDKGVPVKGLRQSEIDTVAAWAFEAPKPAEAPKPTTEQLRADALAEARASAEAK